VDVGRAFSAINRSNGNDDNGHGTHVAGTIAAKNDGNGVVGVAAGANVVPVKVLDRRGSGTFSGVIAGVDYVAANGSNGDVANMSLTGGGYSALDNAVSAAAAKGIKFALAAGNDGSNANNYSPARTNGGNIYTVSAINSSNVFASWSNYGNPPVDYAAPGVSVLSTWKGARTTRFRHVHGRRMSRASYIDPSGRRNRDGDRMGIRIPSRTDEWGEQSDGMTGWCASRHPVIP
jgi:subtilisin family serine protease